MPFFAQDQVLNRPHFFHHIYNRSRYSAIDQPWSFGYFWRPRQPQQKHAPLPIDKTHFDRWISLFSEITDELFEGEKATAAKEKAVKMSLLFQARLQLYQAQKENRP